MIFNDTQVRNVCKKCGAEIIEHQRFIVTCCGAEMERHKVNGKDTDKCKVCGVYRLLHGKMKHEFELYVSPIKKDVS